MARARMRAEMEALRAANERLVAEQAALRRVAAAEAAGAAAQAIHTLVATEAARLAGGHAAAVFRRLPGAGPGTQRLLGGHAWPPPPGSAIARAPVADGGHLWGELRAAGADAGRLAQVAGMLGPALTAAERRSLSIRLLATDALTGLATHRAFRERLAAETSRSRRHRRPLALALVDVDRFAEVNRRGGVHAGDRVLIELAEVLRAGARSEDVAARLGRDAFALLLPEVDRHGAHAIVERVRAQAARNVVLRRERLTLTAGICDLETAAPDGDLLRLAESALLFGKAHGRDVTWVYDPAVTGDLEGDGRTAGRDRFEALAGLRALARAVDAKDPSTKEHSERVADLARLLARELGWSAARAEQLAEAALLHDVGKIGVPDAILLKPERLTPEERTVVEAHAALGAEIVGDVLGPEQVRWIACHHERPDGRGYPYALRGDQVPDGAAILALADAWDVMTTRRPYSRPLTVERAFAECRGLAGGQFRADVVEALAQLRAAGALPGPQPEPSARR